MKTKLDLYNHYFWLFTKMWVDSEHYSDGDDIEDDMVVAIALSCCDAIDCYKITHPNYQG